MKGVMFVLFGLLLPSASSYGQSYSFSPENVTFAGNYAGNKSRPYVETTTVNWKEVEFRISGEKAVSITYKDPDAPETEINPSEKQEHMVLENSPHRVVMITMKSLGYPPAFHLTVDVIFPEDGNGFAFYVSDYPKWVSGHKLNGVSKLYVYKCKGAQ